MAVVILSARLQQSGCPFVGLMLLGCGMMTTGLPLVLTAGVTGALPGGSDYYSSSSFAGSDQNSLGRVLLSDGGGAAPDPGKQQTSPWQSVVLQQT